MKKKNIYSIETVFIRDILCLILLIAFVIVVIAVIPKRFDSKISLGNWLIILLGIIGYFMTIYDTIIFRIKRKKALSQPVFSAGEIIGVKNIPQSAILSAIDKSQKLTLSVKLFYDGNIISTPEIRKKYLKRIVSERVNIYKYKDFYYVGDIQLKSERGEIPINIPKM
jgi:hypothetical protein